MPYELGNISILPNSSVFTSSGTKRQEQSRSELLLVKILFKAFGELLRSDIIVSTVLSGNIDHIDSSISMNKLLYLHCSTLQAINNK